MSRAILFDLLGLSLVLTIVLPIVEQRQPGWINSHLPHGSAQPLIVLALFLTGLGIQWWFLRREYGLTSEAVYGSIYDLPADIGRFGVAVLGSILLHLRDPMRALEAVRGVCGGVFLSAEQIDLPTTLRARRRPLATLNGVGSMCQWWVPNRFGHLQMLRSAGFGVEQVSRPYAIPYGGHHPARKGVRRLVNESVQRAALRGVGVPHSAALVRPDGRCYRRSVPHEDGHDRHALGAGRDVCADGDPRGLEQRRVDTIGSP